MYKICECLFLGVFKFNTRVKPRTTSAVGCRWHSPRGTASGKEGRPTQTGE
jgi:hypothetical protein